METKQFIHKSNNHFKSLISRKSNGSATASCVLYMQVYLSNVSENVYFVSEYSLNPKYIYVYTVYVCVYPSYCIRCLIFINNDGFGVGNF